MISLKEAHHHISKLSPLHPTEFLIDKALGLVCAEDVFAKCNCPTIDSSLKDGFAVISPDISKASPINPVALTLAGFLTAGENNDDISVHHGSVVKVMTGASIPKGATAVLASEFAKIEGNHVIVTADCQPGLNILPQGSDIKKQEKLLEKGQILEPAHLGLLAAAGLKSVSCYSLPQVAVVATGNELVWPGTFLAEGKVAASNLVTAAAQLELMGITPLTFLIHDNLERLCQQFYKIIQQVDVLITCGGVLDGDKDLTLKAMEKLGIEKIFHRVRIGPGKGACMGKIGKTTVFNLPGGPPSNHVALLLLALPGVRRLKGVVHFLPPKRHVNVSEKLTGQKDWTQLVYGRLRYDNGSLYAKPLQIKKKRLEVMASADVLIEIPEGSTEICKDSLAEAWFYRSSNTI